MENSKWEVLENLNWTPDLKLANNFCLEAGHLSGQGQVLTWQKASLVGQFFCCYKLKIRDNLVFHCRRFAKMLVANSNGSKVKSTESKIDASTRKDTFTWIHLKRKLPWSLSSGVDVACFIIRHDIWDNAFSDTFSAKKKKKNISLHNYL